MMAEGICHAPNSPSIFFIFEGRDYFAASAQSASENRVWIAHHQHQADRSSRAKLRRQRLGAEVQELRRFIRHPEFRAADRQLRDHSVFFISNAKQFFSPEGRL